MRWRCPICRRPTDSTTDRQFPFCSERCRMADLGAWASGEYVISEPATDLDDSPDFPTAGDDEDEH